MGVYDNARHIQRALKTSANGLTVKEIQDWIARHTTTNLSYNVVRENLIGMMSIGLVVRFPIRHRNGLGYRWKVNKVQPADPPTGPDAYLGPETL